MVKHHLTTYIIVLNEMANTCNKFAICKACKEAILQEHAYSNKIVNTKKCVKAHLSKCTHFFTKYVETDNYQESDSDLENDSEVLINKPKPLSRYVTYTLTPSQQKSGAQLDTNGITLTMDEWTNVKVQNVSTERSRTTEIVEKIEALAKSIQDANIKVLAIVTNSAAQYASARHTLQITYPEIIYLPCFAHQVNLCMGDIFKANENFNNAAKNANKISTYLTSKLHTYFIRKLWDEQKSQYNKYINLIPSSITRWNSYYYCFENILNNKEALKVRFFYYFI
ncbi:hypothetical protein F8M41_000798 [Gigaspora margarita]|uniref:DUF659 domain-containing protein n=1 Tax=Gigaspora margarita TaxID=4874 RepID=A0A8H3XFF9_GIGMA|nr:hypothetical protein F8M41_000798 [Gigaspora margarita]